MLSLIDLMKEVDKVDGCDNNGIFVRSPYHKLCFYQVSRQINWVTKMLSNIYTSGE